MISKVIIGSIFDNTEKIIAYAISTDGWNETTGFAGQVSKYVPALARTGKNLLGTVIQAEYWDNNKEVMRTFYAMVCYKPPLEGGWDGTPKAIHECLNKINAEEEPVAIVLMGASKIGDWIKRDVIAHAKAIHESPKMCVVYHYNENYTQDILFEALNIRQPEKEIPAD